MEPDRLQQDRTDEEHMAVALDEARSALSHGDVPIGAVAVHQGKVISRGHNTRERDQDPTAHAEIIVLREAAAALGSWRLTGVSLYVTLEPCPMCAGAMVAARIDRLVYGAADELAGAAWSLYNLVQDDRLNHRCVVTSGVLEGESSALLSDFFRGKRGNTASL